MFDTDGNGTINRSELECLFVKLGQLSGKEVGVLMDAIDKNDDGKIQYEEFVEWITSTRVQDRLEGGTFDIETALRPLFSVYDRDGSGSISQREFHECYCILQRALLHHAGNAPTLMAGPEDRVWESANLNRDGNIDYEEFTRWIRNCLDQSGLAVQHLTELLQKLATLLQGVFALNVSGSCDIVQEKPNPVVDKVLAMVGQCGHELFHVQRNAQSSCPSDGPAAPALWVLPQPLPEAMSGDQLVHRHVQDNVPTAEMLSLDVRIQACVGTSQDRWLARLVRRSTYNNRYGSVPPGGTVEEDFFYAYEANAWKGLVSGSEFFGAMQALPMELKVYALLLGAARLRDVEGTPGNIDWQALQAVLKEAIDLGLLTREDFLEYIVQMESSMMAVAVCEAEGDRAKAKDIVQANLSHLRVSPTQVMRQLAKLCIVRPHALWAEKPKQLTFHPEDPKLRTS